MEAHVFLSLYPQVPGAPVPVREPKAPKAAPAAAAAGGGASTVAAGVASAVAALAGDRHFSHSSLNLPPSIPPTTFQYATLSFDLRV